MPPAKRRTARKTAAKKTTARKPAKRRTVKKAGEEDDGTEAGQASHRQEGSSQEGHGEAPRSVGPRRRLRKKRGTREAPDREEGSCEEDDQEGAREASDREEGAAKKTTQEGAREAPDREEGSGQEDDEEGAREASDRQEGDQARHRRSAAPPSAASQHHRIYVIEGALRGPFVASHWLSGIRRCSNDSEVGRSSLNASPPARVDLARAPALANAALWVSARRRACSSMPMVERHWLLVAEEGVDLGGDRPRRRPVRCGRSPGLRRGGALAGRCGVPASGKKCGSRAATMPSITSSPAWR